MKREWTVPMVGEGDSEAIQDSLVELTTILLRLGGVGGIAPHRVEQADGSYQVDRVVFRYDSYAPGLNRPDNGTPEPEPEPEEVKAE